ncbi:hypothetical protein GPEL0_01f4724 [Geoanaerobacter pelophilus]|uniref:Uncharacterized protein n=1 Tax=Geoanaerobacter pelophilus TaxID=60036 RepID=A0ABQ0MMX1_9BACT|nr:hypothetical protein GPEL0_01f4724 [Geoanaerobacter pelophilus]
MWPFAEDLAKIPMLRYPGRAETSYFFMMRRFRSKKRHSLSGCVISGAEMSFHFEKCHFPSRKRNILFKSEQETSLRHQICHFRERK